MLSEGINNPVSEGMSCLDLHFNHEVDVPEGVSNAQKELKEARTEMETQGHMRSG